MRQFVTLSRSSRGWGLPRMAHSPWKRQRLLGGSLARPATGPHPRQPPSRRRSLDGENPRQKIIQPPRLAALHSAPFVEPARPGAFEEDTVDGTRERCHEPRGSLAVVTGSTWSSAQPNNNSERGWALDNLARLRSDESGNRANTPSKGAMWTKSFVLTAHASGLYPKPPCGPSACEPLDNHAYRSKTDVGPGAWVPSLPAAPTP